MKQKLIVICIGNIPIGFIIKNKTMVIRIQKRYKGYIKSIKPVFRFNCSFSIVKKFSKSEEVTLTQSQENNWHAYRNDFNGIWNLSNGTVYMRPSIYSFDAFIRVVYSVSMLKIKGFLLHSSCLVLDKKAYVFIGPSGSGKTTIARNARGGIVLNDEVCALFKDSNKKRTYVMGTPFWGEMGTGPAINNSYPLQGLYFLRKNTFCRKMTLSHEQTIQKILRCVCLYGNNTMILQDILDTCIRIVNQTQAYVLDFEKNSNFIRTICHYD